MKNFFQKAAYTLIPLLLAAALTACGGGPAPLPTRPPAPEQSAAPAKPGSDTAPPTPEAAPRLAEAELVNTRWSGVQSLEFPGEPGGGPAAYPLPNEEQAFELFLMEDGAARFLAWHPFYGYRAETERLWRVEGDAVVLYLADSSEVGAADETLRLVLNAEGLLCMGWGGAQEICFARQSEFAQGSQYLDIDLWGDWKTVSIKRDGELLDEAAMAADGIVENLIFSPAELADGEPYLHANYQCRYPADIIFDDYEVCCERCALSDRRPELAAVETTNQVWSAELLPLPAGSTYHTYYLSLEDQNHLTLVLWSELPGEEPGYEIRRMVRMSNTEPRLGLEAQLASDVPVGRE